MYLDKHNKRNSTGPTTLHLGLQCTRTPLENVIVFGLCVARYVWSALQNYILGTYFE